MAEPVKLTGPDFGTGVHANTVRDGEPLLGHANGDAVLLIRRGDDFLAISATCTHYGGPLAEGRIDGDDVRCPWHHACFNLRTGEALRAPALSPVACWIVERRNEKILITGKREHDPLSPTYPVTVDRSAAPRTVAIVGCGAAGSAAAEMLRRSGYDGRLTIVDEENGSPYDRPNLSKDYLAGNAPEEWIPLRSANFYPEHKIDVIRGRATRIDAKNRKLEMNGREPLEYDALLLATGAEPIRLDVPGANREHVHTLRSLADSRAIIAAAQGQACGGGRRQLHRARGRGLVARSETGGSRRRHGIAPARAHSRRASWNLYQVSTRIEGCRVSPGPKPAVIDTDSVTLDDGSHLPADLVVMGVGVRPRLTLAEGAGLAMDRGVSVNEFLETSVPRIFAAGDIARWPDPHTGDRIRVEHWVLAQRHGQTAARNMLGAARHSRRLRSFGARTTT